jgi:hypothetical protein
MSNLSIADKSLDWRASLGAAMVDSHSAITLMQAMQTAIITVEIRCDTVKKEFIVPVRKIQNYQASPLSFTARGDVLSC